jgi:hypothetical protein
MGAVVLALVAAACISGPIPGPVSLGTGFDVGLVGYQRSEFFMTNLAQSYAPVDPLAADGRWNVAPDPTQVAYKTRLVVYRPADPARFNGTVVVEWLNVTAGVDLANDWVMAHNELVRSGAAWVGVSAQAVGVNALKTGTPDRYGSLVHPGDSYSYDIFTHAGHRILDTPAVLGGLATERLIATGESQSASRLVSYINALHPLRNVYDGFLVHSRGAGASPLRQAPLSAVPSPSPVAIRNDIDVPVMVVQAEGDVISSNLGARQPDTPLFRSWEMAGTSHADSYTVSAGFNDIGDGSGAVNMFAFMRAPQNAGCANPINAGPHHWILQTAFNGLDTWISSGVPPAAAPLLDVESTSPTVLVRDEFGNARGGIRSPHVDAPIATLTGINTGGGFCRLFGTTIPFTAAQLTALYPTHEDFVAAWDDALASAVAAGFILEPDADELLNAASNSTVPI